MYHFDASVDMTFIASTADVTSTHRRGVTPPRLGNLRLSAPGIFTADFGEAAQCGQHFIPGWGPW